MKKLLLLIVSIVMILVLTSCNESEIITFDKNVENSIKVILKENDARILLV